MDSKRIYGLIGYPVKHSLSPTMHNAAFHKLGIDAEYRLFEVKPDELEKFLLDNIQIEDIDSNSFYSQEIEGFNITIPHKVKAREILEREFPFDKNLKMRPQELHYVIISGAVNTVKREAGILTYWNTDADGFLKSLEKDLKFDKKDNKVLLLGCGGAGRAVIACLSWRQQRTNKIYIYEVSKQTISSAKRYFAQLTDNYYIKEFFNNNVKFISIDEIPQVIKDCDLLVNATPIGMKEGDGSIVNKNLLHNGLYVYDLVYNRETQLIKDAKACKLNYINGLKMLWRQGMLSFEIWVNDKESPKKKAPQEVMWKALCSQISLQ